MTSSLVGAVPAIIDTHIHQWNPLVTPHPTAAMAKLNRFAPWLVDFLVAHVVPRETTEFIRTTEHVLRPYLPETFAADVAPVEVPVEGVVHVQADWRGKGPMGPVEETRWLMSLPFGQEGLPKLLGIVGGGDPRDAHFAALLDAHRDASPVFRGVRCMGAWHADKHVHRYGDAAGLFRQPEFLRGFAALAERGLTFDAYVYSHQLDDVTVLAKEYPDTTIVLDHYAPLVGWAGPMGSQGATTAERTALFDQWHDAISRLAEHPNVVAKHSGLAFPMLGLPTATYTRESLAEIVAPLVEHTTDAFGPDRLMFGSNFPMDKALAPYHAVVGALTDLLAPRGEELLRKVFRENAQRIYTLD
jgi:predicted TIM-barrel fold metal-dependent hydrolase